MEETMIYKEGAIALMERQAPEGLKSPNQPYRVLVVDDSTTMRKIIAQQLRAQAYEVCGEAEDGLQAIALYKELDPDVVTLDINMPVADGHVALREILAYDRDAKVVMLTSEGQKSTVAEAVSAGASGFVVKPPNKTLLCEKVKQALRA